MLKYLLVIAVYVCACNNPEATTNTIEKENIAINVNGADLDYTDSRTGDTTLFFVHGWNIDKSYWSEQVKFFSDRYRVITMDLPGFGKSGKEWDTWTVSNYGSSLNGLITGLELKNIVLVGHSMSGAIVVESALRNPRTVIAVVGVDNFTNFGYRWTKKDTVEANEFYDSLRKDYKKLVSAYADKWLFSPSTDTSVRKRVKNDFANADSVIAVKALESCDKYPLDDKLQELGRTLYLINSSLRQTDTGGFAKLGVQYKLYQVGPTGHYPMIENPALFNARMQEILSQLKK